MHNIMYFSPVTRFAELICELCVMTLLKLGNLKLVSSDLSVN